MAQIVRETPAGQEYDSVTLRKLIEEYKNHKALIESTQKRVDGFKESLTTYLTSFGKPDEKGNLWIELGDVELKRERRISKSFNSSAAEA